MKKTIVGLYVWCLACMGCTVDNTISQSGHAYYDIKGLLNQQVQYLGQMKTQVQKITFLNDTRDTTLLTLDSAGWAKELEVFENMDINDAALIDAYTVKDKLTDPNSNLQVISYTAKEPQKNKVEELKVYYLKNQNEVRKVKASYKEKNTLYQHQNKAHMIFESVNGQLVLVSYHLEGHQKMLISDSLNYWVEGEVQF